jgi:4-alpha-glucanotransferase
MNTHDTATFAGFWRDADLDDSEEMGLLTPEESAGDRDYRDRVRQALVAFLRTRGWLDDSDGVVPVLRACLLELAAGPAEFLLLSIEDFWGEIQRQNTPGTVDERPNWRRKALFSLEDFTRLPEVVELMRRIDALRRRERESSRRL